MNTPLTGFRERYGIVGCCVLWKEQGYDMNNSMEEKAIFSMKDIGPLIEEMVGQGEVFRLTVSGTSMMPFLRNNRDEVIGGPYTETRRYHTASEKIRLWRASIIR